MKLSCLPNDWTELEFIWVYFSSKYLKEIVMEKGTAYKIAS